MAERVLAVHNSTNGGPLPIVAGLCEDCWQPEYDEDGERHRCQVGRDEYGRTAADWARVREADESIARAMEKGQP